MPHHAEKVVQRYLENLSSALQQAPASIRRAALRDAEEFLQNEVASLVADRSLTATEIYGYFVHHYGSPEQVAAEYFDASDLEPSSKGVLSRWKSIAAVLLLWLTVAGGVCFAMLREPPKLSPFTDVVVTNDQVLVEFKGEVSEWLAIDDILVTNIVASAKEQFGRRWEKRIVEDIVEVLWGMGHSPGQTVKLRLRDPETGEETVVDSAPLTYENRRIVYAARRAREDQRDHLRSQAMRRDPVGYVQREVQQRWAYYPLMAADVDAAFDRLRDKIAIKPGIDFALEIQKVIATGIDGHARVRGWRLPGRQLPFLIEPVGDRYAAFLADRSGYVDAKHPFIASIDGVSLDEWCQAASVLEARGSSQYVKRQALRHLRSIDYWREEVGVEVSDSLQLKLVSPDANDAVEIELTTAENKPLYGRWPRTESRLLEGNIGYLRLASMNDRAQAEIRKFIPQFKSTAGLIVDVRGNGGGSRAALRRLFSYFMAPDDTPHVVNCAKYRLHPEFLDDHLETRYLYPADSERWTAAERQAIASFRESFRPQWQPPAEQFSSWHYFVLSRLDDAAVYHYQQPIVVLMDSKCFSATDIFLAALKGWRNVTLVGTPSSGGSARRVSFDLPDRFAEISLASMASFQPNGKLYDGNGVQPDIVVEPTPGYFTGEADNVLDEGLKLLQSPADK